MADIKKIKIGSTSYDIKDKVARDTLDNGIISTGRYYNPDLFTIVGTPIISDDGIASGFSSKNYINTILLPYDKLNYCITLKDYKYLGGQSFIFGNRNIADEQSLNIIFNANKILLFASSTGTSWDIAHTVTSSSTFISGNTYDISFVRENGSLYKVVVYDHSNNTTTTESTVSTNSNLFNSPNLIAIGAGSWQPYTGSIDLKQFSITVDGNKVLDGSNYLINNGDLDTKTIEEKMHALKCYPDKGELLTDRQGLEAVKSYNRSTFDLSKFTVTGTPTITDDGVVSGFSGSNYIQKNISLSSNYEIILPVKITDDTTSLQGIARFYDNNDNVICQVRKESSAIFISGFDSVVTNFAFGRVYTLNKVMYLKIIKSASTLILSTSNDLENWTSETFDLTGHTISNITKIVLGIANPSWTSLQGQIDLKQFSITVDGQEVFNGNKTGVDVIKADDFTVVGSPAITDDGIASGFSSSNYLTKENAVTISDTGEFRIDFKFNNTVASDLQYIFDLYNTISDEIILRRATNGQYTLICFANSTAFFNKVITITPDNVVGYVEYKNGVYTFDINGTQQTMTSNTKMSALAYDLALGVSLASGTVTQPLVNGSIDLNSFKIYVDGNLIYQPLLRIPYNQSKTGSKVVQEYYRDRVLETYNYQGYANYYTLLEDKKPHYTVVGSPTISSDYVASGFSAENYVNTNINSSTFANPFEIYFKFNASNVGSRQSIIGLATAYGFHINIFGGKMRLGLSSNGSSLDIANNVDSTLTINANQDYIGRLTWNGSTYKLDLLINSTWTNYISVTSSSAIITGYNLLIGIVNNVYPLMYGSIDLKQFKIYVDNNIVYQAVEEPDFTLPMSELYGFMNHGSGDVSVDNNTIISSNGTISAVGLKNSNTNNNTVKTWTGTIDQYNAISTKDDTTLYMITDDDTSVTTPILQTIYPVGSIYITTNSTCPLAALFGTWELVASDMVLQGAGTRGSVGTTLPESLPNITGKLTIGNASDGGCWIGNMQMSSGCVVPTNYCNTAVYCNNTASNKTGYASASIDASKSSSVYTNGATHVQPSAYLVNIFRRTA